MKQSMITKQAAWLSDGRTIFDLTTDEINSLIAIADSSRGLAGAQARGMLEFAYDSAYAYINCPEIPVAQKSAQLDRGSENPVSDLKVTVKPNPASNIIIFTFSLPERVSDGMLTLYYSNGKMIEKHPVVNENSEFQYNCSELPAGIYYYSLSTSTGIVSGKFVIIR